MSVEDKIIEELEKKFNINEEVSFNEYNLAEKLQNHSFVLLQYNQILLREKINLSKLEEILNKKLGEKYHYYRFNFDEQLTKPEIEKYYLVKDKDILKIKELLRKQEIVVGFFEACVKSIESMGWDIKNFIENSKRGY